MDAIDQGGSSTAEAMRRPRRRGAGRRGQVRQLDQRLDVLRKEAELYDPNRPADWQEQFRRDEAALQARIDAAREQLPENSLLDDLVAETLFRTVGPAEAHELSGIPQTFLSGKSIEDIDGPPLAEGPGQNMFVVHEPEGWALVPKAGLATMPEDWWAMGGGLVMHGDAVSYFNTAREWGPALAFTSDGKMVRLGSDDECWLKLRGVSAEPYARYSEAVSWLAGRTVPSSASAYLAGTSVGNLPEVLRAFPATSGGAPTPAAEGTPTPAVTETPVPVATPSPAPPTAGPAPPTAGPARARGTPRGC